jgi:DNA polymerase-4
VEQRDSRLRGRLVIIGAGVVLAGSYEARSRGVRMAIGGLQAGRLCPEAIGTSERKGIARKVELFRVQASGPDDTG